MGDIITGIFGGQGQQQQTNNPDPVAHEMNVIRLGQLQNLFNTGETLSQFQQPGSSQATTQTDFSRLLSDMAQQEMTNPRQSEMSFRDYQDSFGAVTRNYEDALARVNAQTQEAQAGNETNFNRLRDLNNTQLSDALAQSRRDYETGISQAQRNYETGVAQNQTGLESILSSLSDSLNARLSAQREAFDASRRGNRANLNRALAEQETGRQRAIDLGTGTVGNIVDTIATPRLNQALALQGLESGGAVPMAIARATSEQALPYLQAIEQLYGTNAANLLSQFGQTQGALRQANMGEIAQAHEQNIGLATAARTQNQDIMSRERMQNQDIMSRLAQSLMSNNVSLEQAGISANSALGQQLLQAQSALAEGRVTNSANLANTQSGLQAHFLESLPEAERTIALTPEAVRAARLSNINSLTSLADQPRQLAENDLLRRQGFVTSIFTGIPFTPGTTQNQQSSSPNIFEQLFRMA